MKFSESRKRALAAVAACAVAASAMIGVAPAGAVEASSETSGTQAYGAEGRAAWAYYYKIISKSSSGSYVGSQKLASCGSRNTAVTCSLNQGSTATRSIGLDLGASRGWAAGQLKISSSTSQNVSVTCSKQKVPKGKQLVAYPVGVRHKYKIQKHMTGGGKDYVTGTSGWLYAFNPGNARVACDIKSF
ncbi:hypothetical protein FHW23_001178 [Curtobacterium pusillum]|uniref:Tat pathway signal sequence domain protein n=1 Tax=Curtobacterium pusillum TaxID=69373 RepID=A0AAW3T4V4_9MICO|nr:hypothetical protein [Curtobacterium pusillum]MBA8989932.1 hypothetical protein [Curtobacterium pusillum]